MKGELWASGDITLTLTRGCGKSDRVLVCINNNGSNSRSPDPRVVLWHSHASRRYSRNIGRNRHRHNKLPTRGIAQRWMAGEGPNHNRRLHQRAKRRMPKHQHLSIQTEIMTVEKKAGKRLTRYQGPQGRARSPVKSRGQDLQPMTGNVLQVMDIASVKFSCNRSVGPAYGFGLVLYVCLYHAEAAPNVRRCTRP